MEQIKQLKTIRDDALGRLHNNPDYKLLTSLDTLIIELEGVTALAELAEKSVSQQITSKTPNAKEDDKKPQSLDQAFDKLNSAKKTNGSGGSVVDLSEEINGGVALS